MSLCNPGPFPSSIASYPSYILRADGDNRPVVSKAQAFMHLSESVRCLSKTPHAHTAYIDSKSTRDSDDPGHEVRVGDLDLLFSVKDLSFHGGHGLASSMPFGSTSSSSSEGGAGNQSLKATASFVVVPSVCNTFGGMHGKSSSS